MAKSKAFLGQFSDADLRLLKIFKIVADAKGLSAAEAKLNISCSTISKYIGDLEQRLNLVLCVRGRGGFRLTDEGVSVYQAITKLNGAIDNFKLSINELHESISGTIRVGLFDKILSNPNANLIEALERFTTLAPEVKLELMVEPLNSIETNIVNEHLHLGIVPTIKQVSGIEYCPLFDEHMSLYRSPNLHLEGTDEQALMAIPYVGLGYYSPNMAISQTLNLISSAVASDQEAVAIMILTGKYIGFLPDHYAANFVAEKKLIKIENQRFTYDCSFKLIHKNSKKLNRPASILKKCLIDSH
ncbi:LysR family transcriptional regulator [Alteromonas oceanisediminis]|uniref:LysR family transcriptional regulator n=1 Tax=Alteromonas oceanisediminis TaxID=2836180 RepID=UPI001BDB43BD|nr:LysR family transcriptional regulator [Alteromonas oceanisediminis]MBT0585175.1 LysR family transcriptional regulator [Alteromonas oceanisediminis]